MHTAKRKGVLCFLTVLAITGAYKSAFAACTTTAILGGIYYNCTGISGNIYAPVSNDVIDVAGTASNVRGDNSNIDTVGGDDIITIKSGATVTGSVQGDNLSFLGPVLSGGDDVITIESGATVRGLVQGDWIGDTWGIGGDDTITVQAGATVGGVQGDTLLGQNSVGGDDTIIIGSAGGALTTVNGVVLGDFINDINPTGGNDTITIINSTVTDWIIGDSLIMGDASLLLATSNFAQAGADTITVQNSTVEWVAGERIFGDTSILSTGATGGADTILIENSTVNDTVVGDYFVDVSNGTAATNSITINNSTVVNRVAGGMLINGNNNTGAANTIILDASSAREVDGAYFIGTNNVSAPASIVIRNGSSVSTYVFGDLMVGGSNTGSDSNISITDSQAGVVVGSGILGSNNTGGNASITVSNSTVDAVVGDLFQYGDNNKAGNDTINVVSGSTVNNGIYGDYFDGGSGHVAGNDTITINNATVNGDIYGEYYTNGATEATPGDDTINLASARVNGSIYGGNGSDTVNYNGNGNAVSGIIDGGDDVGTADGYIDTLNINGYSGAAFNNYVNFEDVNLVGATLDYGSNFASPESLNYNIDSNSALILTGGGSGVYEINSSVNNSGLMDFSDGTVGDHLDITGNFDSKGGVYLIDVDFNSRQADSITVGGEFTGSGTIQVNPLYVTSAASSDALEIVVVNAPNDTSHGDENFVYVPSQRYNNSPYLARFKESPFIWQLRDSNGNLVLGYIVPSDETGKALPEAEAAALMPEPKQTVIPEIPAYVSLPTFGREVVMNELDTMHQRLGELRNHLGWVGTDGSVQHPNEYYNSKIDFDESKVNGWARGTASHFDFSEGSSFDVDGNYMSVDLGFDKRFKLSEDKSLFFWRFLRAVHRRF